MGRGFGDIIIYICMPNNFIKCKFDNWPKFSSIKLKIYNETLLMCFSITINVCCINYQSSCCKNDELVLTISLKYLPGSWQAAHIKYMKFKRGFNSFHLNGREIFCITLFNPDCLIDLAKLVSNKFWSINFKIKKENTLDKVCWVEPQIFQAKSIEQH